MKTIQMQLAPLSCPSCVARIERALAQRPGVEEVKVLFNASRVQVRFDDGQSNPEALAKVLTDLGYPVLAQR
ncbi:MAG: heavy-metal-associated domain-containing protein [Firmicutes bacterium]|nr:heavy-metal-associated domain-containing protein [Bacillota bacterium]